MKLPEKDRDIFFKLYNSLLFHANKKFKVMEGVEKPEKIFHYELKEIHKLRMKLYDHPDLIDSFVRENPENFSPAELEIISSWKNFIRDRFYIIKHLKKYSVLLSEEEPAKAYGVLALNTTFEEMIGPQLPVMIGAVLLPFKDRIVYDSIFNPYPINFGSGIRQILNNTYQQAKSRFGIITSLPFKGESAYVDDLEQLKFYLRNEPNREEYWGEIFELINKDRSLLIYFHQKMGKIHARTYGKRLRNLGLKKGWFGIIDGIIIASGTTKKKLKGNIERITPPDKKDLVYLFELKSK